MAAGFPGSVSAYNVSDFHSCGLQATQSIATQVRNGSVDIGLVLGADRVRRDRKASPVLRDEYSNHREPYGSREAADLSELDLDDLGIPSSLQDQYRARTVHNFERAQISLIQDEKAIPHTALSSVYDQMKIEKVKKGSDRRIEGLEPATYEGVSAQS